MKNRRAFVKGSVAFTATLAVLCAHDAWAEELVICKSCGREAKEGETTCSRCGEALPRPRPVAPAGPAEAPAVDVPAEVLKMVATAVEGNYRLAKEAEEAKQPALALCYYQSAMALMRLLPPNHFPKEVGDALLNGRVRMLQTVMAGHVKCRICNGTGKYQMDMSKTDPAGTIKAVSGVPCKACNGRGGIPGMADVPQAKAALLQGRSEFERRQMLAGEVRLGRTFVSSALEKLLTPPQRALVMTGMQVPCDSCQGTARQVCATCRGTRWVKCTFTGCRNGEIDLPKTKDVITTKRLNEDVTTKCPRCLGFGEITCGPCNGNGSVACQQCSGSGTAPRCQRCTGTGTQECSKCKGAGNIKGTPCADCGGGGVALCATCRGEGVRTR